MTFLVEQIAFDEQASPITDVPELDEIATFLRTRDADIENRWTAKQAVINLVLPKDIEKLDIDKFIEFRNDIGMAELRIAYNKTIDAVYTTVEQNFDPYTYLESLNTLNKGLIKEIGTFFGSTAVFTLNCFLSAPHLIQSAEIIEKLLEGGVAISGLTGIKKEWNLSADRRMARKFLSRVQHLNR